MAVVSKRNADPSAHHHRSGKGPACILKPAFADKNRNPAARTRRDGCADQLKKDDKFCFFSKKLFQTINTHSWPSENPACRNENTLLFHYTHFYLKYNSFVMFFCVSILNFLHRAGKITGSRTNRKGCLFLTAHSLRISMLLFIYTFP